MAIPERDDPSANPYAAPEHSAGAQDESLGSPQPYLATRSQRFMGALADGVIGFVIGIIIWKVAYGA